MATSIRRVPIDKDTELGRLVDEAEHVGDLVILEIDGRDYRLVPQPHITEDPWKDYDAEAVKRALTESAGAFSGMDAARFKQEIREQRGQDSSGRPG